MIIRKLKDCPEIRAGDGSALRELFHPARGGFAFGYSLARAVVAPGRRTRRSCRRAGANAVDAR
ncbi:MAG TPA: hypothetical protein VMS75_01565 [Terriglobales bacterium]|nr:hypothetical protein [Terriglobales bacterium]